MLQKPIKRHSSSKKQASSDAKSYSKLIDLFYSNWVWRAVHALSDHPKFKSSPTWIAKTLSISVEEVVDALEGLEELGFLVKKESSYVSKSPQILLPEEKTTKSFAISCHKKLSQQMLIKSQVSEVEGTMTCFVNVEKSAVHELLRRIFSDLNALNEVRSVAPDAELFSFSLTCSNLAPSLKDSSHEA